MNYKWSFSIAMLVYQRVATEKRDTIPTIPVQSCPHMVFSSNIGTPNHPYFTLWYTNIAMENGPVEIVYLPIIIAMVIFQLANC
jgi:hypothetical protein